ncbi:MAG: PQQ-binding-like beta-propeller repeat protein [Thermomicrobiales bacterium]
MPMFERDERKLERELSRYWNAITTGEPSDASNVDPDLAPTIRYLHEVGSQPKANRAFLDQLSQTLMGVASPAQFHRNGSTAGTLTTLAPAPRPEPVRSATGRFRLLHVRRLGPIAELAAAVLLIFALIGIYFGTDQLMALIPWREQKLIQDTDSGNVQVDRGDPARTGRMPGPAVRSLPKARWTFVDENFGQFSAPAVVDGTIYVFNYDRLLALDADDGSKLWDFHFTLFDRVFALSAPTVADGLVYVGSNNQLYALDAATGKQIWDFPTSEPVVPSSLVVDGNVYFAQGGNVSAEDKLFALNAKTGEELWAFPLNGTTIPSPAYADGVVYIDGDAVGNTRGSLFAVDADTGTLRWSFQTGAPIYTTPLVADAMVFFGDNSGAFFALDAASGGLRWHANYQASPTDPNDLASRRLYRYTTAALDNGTLLVSTFDGTLFAVDEKTGDVLWRVPTSYGQTAPPVVAENVIYFGTQNSELVAIDAADGHDLWRFASNGPIETAATVAGGDIYFGDIGNFYAMTMGEGRSGTPTMTGE